MILIMIIGLVIGIMAGFALNITYPSEFSFYVTMALLAGMDSVVGAARASLKGNFNTIIFVTGFFTNAILAGVLTFIGDKLGVPLYYAAIFVFGGRLFNNLAVIRRLTLDKFLEERASKRSAASGGGNGEGASKEPGLSDGPGAATENAQNTGRLLLFTDEEQQAEEELASEIAPEGEKRAVSS